MMGLGTSLRVQMLFIYLGFGCALLHQLLLPSLAVSISSMSWMPTSGSQARVNHEVQEAAKA